MRRGYSERSISPADSLCDIPDNPHAMTVKLGNDWFFFYGDYRGQIEMYDFAKIQAPAGQEDAQFHEMNAAFNEILAGSIEHEQVIRTRLREDTSYLLYLMKKHSGIIEQEGADVRHKFGEHPSEGVECTEADQAQTLKKFREIRLAGNPDLMMHTVKFRATIGE